MYIIFSLLLGCVRVVLSIFILPRSFHRLKIQNNHKSSIICFIIDVIIHSLLDVFNEISFVVPRANLSSYNSRARINNQAKCTRRQNRCPLAPLVLHLLPFRRGLRRRRTRPRDDDIKRPRRRFLVSSRRRRRKRTTTTL